MGVLRLLLGSVGATIGLLLLLPVLIVGLPFWLVSRLTHAIARRLEPTYTPYGELIMFDPHFGWRPRGNLATCHLADDVFRLTTDDSGWRGRGTVAESDVIVLGDSFAWGFGVDDDDFFADLAAPVRIKAIGTIGYNMVQELLWLRGLAPQLGGKLVVWLVYLGNDLHENLLPDMCGYRMPFLRRQTGDADWQIVSDHLSPATWPYRSQLHNERRDYYRALARVCMPGFDSDRTYDACRFLIRSGRDVCDAAGATLVVMTVPETTQLDQQGIELLRSRVAGSAALLDPHYPDHRLRQVCLELGVEFVAGADYLQRRHYKQRDCHWNPEGHRRIADLIVTLYRKHPMRARTVNGQIAAFAPPEAVPIPSYAGGRRAGGRS
jgi:hypothetical protein